METESNIILFDFDGVYKTQNFYKNENCRWIQKGRMAGASSYCLPQAKSRLRRSLKNIEQPALVFLGSGNYHYITFLLIEQISEDFTLLLFDHHSDMQRQAFGSLLTCGNWALMARKQLPHLKQTVLVGVNDSDAENLTAQNITVFPAGKVRAENSWLKRLEKSIRYPVYISVDKDVFSKDAAVTNWEQGQMSLKQFSAAFCAAVKGRRVIGMDVCGEFPAIYSNLFVSETANRKNNEINRKLLELWKRYAFSVGISGSKTA